MFQPKRELLVWTFFFYMNFKKNFKIVLTVVDDLALYIFIELIILYFICLLISLDLSVFSFKVVLTCIEDQKQNCCHRTLNWRGH